MLSTLLMTSLLTTAVGGQGVDDAPRADVLESIIERELLADPVIPMRELDVTVAEGIVTLSGHVDDLAAADRAVRLAETIRGVRAVIDRLEVRPSDVPDDVLRERITAALVDDPATESYEISLDVLAGHAVLSGRVDSHHEKRLAESVARSVAGVTGLTSELVVAPIPGEPRLDLAIEQELRRALEWDVLVDDWLLDVQVADGVVTLTGLVEHAAAIRRVSELAWTHGVRDVDTSGLDVAASTLDDPRRDPRAVERTDVEIEAAVIAAMSRDPRVWTFDVDVDVDAGVVHLDGIVGNLVARRAAERDARHTVGVQAVRNDLEVRTITAMPDVSVDAKLDEALARDPFVDGYQIATEVHGGVATLSGEVDSAYEKQRADAVAARVLGVLDVRNELVVVDDDSAVLRDVWVDAWDVRPLPPPSAPADDG